MAKLPFVVFVPTVLERGLGDYKSLEKVFNVKYGKKTSLSEGKPYTEDELMELCQGVDGIIATASDRLTGRVIRSSRSLRCIAQRNVGYDNIDIKAATELGVLVTNAPSKHTQLNAAEHTVAMILSLARKLNVSKVLLKQGVNRWDERFDPLYLGAEVTIGFVGYGEIARHVARLLKPFGVRMLCYDNASASRNRARRQNVNPVELNALLRESDFVTIHTPLTPGTRHLIGDEELKLMKPTAYLVNTARGAIVDEQALTKALKERRIGGAALDVSESEPLTPSHVFFNMSNVIFTPHIAGRSAYSEKDMSRIAIKSCIKVLKGIVPSNTLNPDAIPLWKSRMIKMMQDSSKIGVQERTR